MKKQNELKSKMISNVGANCVRQKTDKGITLVALVITIIIMLILVAVTVNYSIKSGLLTKAKEGTKRYTYQEEEDEIGEIRLAYKVDFETGKTTETLEKYLEDVLNEKADITGGNEIAIKYKNTGNEHNIENKALVQEKDWTWEDINKNSIKDTGDIVSHKNGEKFYIIPNDEETKKGKITLLAWYNLNPDTGKQQSGNNYSCAFANTARICFRRKFK